jgi:hypothetical protein
MAIIKLPNVGDTHTMHIKTCERNTGTYGEQVLFSDGTDTLYLPQTSADMQLKRIFGEEFSYTDAVGNSLTFSRTANNKRPGAAPYWNIAPAVPQRPSSGKRMEVPTEIIGGNVETGSDARRKVVARAYCDLFKAVAKDLGINDYSAVQAATATIWISWKDKGIQPDGLDGVVKSVEKAPVVKMPEPSGKRIMPPSSYEEPDYSNFPPPTDDDLPF